MPEQVRPGFRRHHFAGRFIDLPEHLTEAQLDGRACVRCGDEHSPRRPVEAWSELSSQLFECVDTEACGERRFSHGEITAELDAQLARDLGQGQ